MRTNPNWNLAFMALVWVAAGCGGDVAKKPPPAMMPPDMNPLDVRPPRAKGKPPGPGLDATLSPATPKPKREQPPFSGKIVPEVAALFAKSPVRPLPATASTKGFHCDEDARLAWWRQRLVAPFEQAGGHDPKWSEQARAYLDGIARQQANHSQKPPWLDLQTQAASLLDAGCNDPLVQLSYALLLDDVQLKLNADLALKLSDHCTAALSIAPCAPEIRFLAYLHHARLLDSSPEASEQQTRDAKAKTIHSLVEAYTRDLSNLDRQMLVQLVYFRQDQSPLREWIPDLLPALWARPDCDPWLYRLLAARAHRQIGWQARGTGYADTVTEKGWETFKQELEHVRNLSLEAWKSHPELPEAATELMVAALAVGGVADETPRFWFDQAVGACFDHREAYENMNMALLPQWGGSDEELRAFGLECLATKRFDTQVPSMHQQTTWSRFNHVGRDRRFWALAGVYEESRQMIEGYSATWLGKRKHESQSSLAAVAFLAGKHDDARKYLAEVGDEVSAESMLLFDTTLGEVRRGLRSPQTSEQGEILLGNRRGSYSFARLGNAGRGVLTVAGNSTAQFWQAATGKLLGELPAGDAPLSAGAFSANNRLAATASIDGKIKVFELNARAEQSQFSDNWLPRVLAFSPDQKHLAVGAQTEGGAGQLALWDMEAKKISAQWSEHKLPVTSLTFSRTGDFVVSTSGLPGRERLPHPGQVIVWDMAKKDARVRIPPFPLGVFCAALAPDDSVLAVAAGNNLNFLGKDIWGAELVLLDATSGEKVGSLVGHFGSVNALLFVGSRWLVSAGDSGGVHVWDWQTKQRAAIFEGHLHPVVSLAASSDQQELISLDSHGVIKRWPLEGPRLIPSIVCPLTQMRFEHNINHLYFTRHEPALVVSAVRSDMSLWKPQDGYARATKPNLAQPFLLFHSDVSPDGTLAALGGFHTQDSTRNLLLHNLQTGEQRPLVGTRLSQSCVQFSPNGKWLASGGEYGQVYLWDVATGTQLPWGVLSEHQRNSISALAFSPDGTMLATCDTDCVLKLWELPSEPEKQTAPLASRFTINTFTSAPQSVAFSPDSGKLLVGDDRAEMWNVKTKQKLFTVPGAAVAFSRDGGRFITAGGRILYSEARIWDTSTGRPLVRLTGGHAKAILSVTFSPDDQRVFTGGYDGRVRCWNAQTGEELDPALSSSTATIPR